MPATGLTYAPLDRSIQQIRLLSIRPMQQRSELHDGSLVCSMEIVELHDANPFYALSYVWGPEDATTTITINNNTIPVRRNLWLFLRALWERFCQSQSPGDQSPSSLRVWADAICIDQSNLVERSYQVSIMGDIYRAADAIYAWLGESNSELDDGMRCIQEMASMRASRRSWLDISKFVNQNLGRLRNITMCSYWTRMWIKQEVLLAKELWFISSKDVARWQDLLLPDNLRQHRDFQDMAVLLKMRHKQLRSFDLRDLIAEFADARCQDGRDRLYALLSLIDSSISQQIVVGYDRPLLQILLENYVHWAEDSTDDKAFGKNAVNVQSVHGFSVCMRRMLSDADLGALWSSPSVRDDVSFCGIFETSPLFRVHSVVHVAAADDIVIRPLGLSKSVGASRCGFVVQMSLLLCATKRSIHAYDCYVYSDVLPGSGDLVAWIGSRVLFLRPNARSADETTSSLMLTGTGTEMHSLEESNRLSAVRLKSPCLWHREQLADARFSIVVDDPLRKARRLYIECNAAAMVMLLLESGRFCLPNGRKKKLQNVPPARSAMLKSWSPYAFGREHGLLDVCGLCRAMGISHVADSPTYVEGVACECRWTVDSV